MNKSIVAIMGLLALAFVPGCKTAKAEGRARGTAEPASAPAAVAAETAKPATPAAQEGPVTELQIGSVGNTMKFDKETLSVKTGARVHLSFHSNSTLAVMPHNWALVKPGTEAAVALAGLNKGENAGYIDPASDVIAYTPLAKPPNETVDVTFTAPAPGTYPYICTVPGHYVVMHGKLIVTE